MAAARGTLSTGHHIPLCAVVALLASAARHLGWLALAFLLEQPQRRESFTQDSWGAEGGAVDDPLGGSDGDRCCAGRREGVRAAAEAITWLRQPDHAMK